MLTSVAEQWKPHRRSSLRAALSLTDPMAGAGGGAIKVANQSYIVIRRRNALRKRAHVNGVIQNTSNGTGLTYQVASYGN